MRHYTVTPAFASLLLVLLPLLTLSAKDYRLYTDCEEYYDSRGFYHNECEKNEFSQKKAMRSFNRLYDLMEPGTGPKPVQENNNSAIQGLDALLGSDTKDKKRTKSIFDESEDNEEDELTQPESEIKQVQTNNRAIKERPKLEFGRE